MFKGDREKCRNLQRIVGSGTPKVLDVKVTGEQASASVEYEGSAIKGVYGALAFVREGGVWKLDKLDDDFVRSTAIVSVRALSTGALSVPQVQECVAKQTLKLSDAAVRKYVYGLFRLEKDAGQSVLRLVNKCPKQVAIYVAEEVAHGLAKDGVQPAVHQVRPTPARGVPDAHRGRPDRALRLRRQVLRRGGRERAPEGSRQAVPTLQVTQVRRYSISSMTVACGVTGANPSSQAGNQAFANRFIGAFGTPEVQVRSRTSSTRKRTFPPPQRIV